MSTNRKRLSDILTDSGAVRKLESAWQATAAAAEFAPLPPGEYTFRVLAGELFSSRGGTPGYKLMLEVSEGDYEGRHVWHDLWLTPAALPMTKRDLAKIGVSDIAQLERPLPPGILIKGRLALRRDDDGNEGNRLTRFEFAGIEPGDAFEPQDTGADADPGAAPPVNGSPTPAAGNGHQASDLFPYGASARNGAAFVAAEKGGRPQ
jgi:hypothetical protein